MAKQITEEQIEKVIEKLVDRIEEANSLFLKKIGSSIKDIKKLTPSQAHQLIQMLKYGEDYNKIIKELTKYTNLNANDIDKIFSAYAKEDQKFYKEFYNYRNVPYIPFDQNSVLINQTKALAELSKQAMVNFANTSAIGYTINGEFFNLKQSYIKVLDEALINISQGKQTFDEGMKSILKDIGGSGLKTIEYQSGRAVRLDSAIRMHLNDGLRNLHNENQKIYGAEFKSDGVEISVHLNPAPDHALVQGRQFSNEEFKKFQEDQDARSYDGVFFPAISEETGHDRRAISQYNCYHYIFPIILGVSKPEYSKEQLDTIRKTNDKGFKLWGKKYTNYQGTQLQRKLETEIRKQKDIQLLAKESGNSQLAGETERAIRTLTDKYKYVSQVSGLPVKSDRLRVSGYKRIQIKNNISNITSKNIFDFSKYKKQIDNNINISTLKEEFDYNGFMEEYNKFYNSFDKKEIEKVYEDYHDWLKTDETGDQPIGKFLNEKLKYDGLPELIDEKDYWVEEDGKPVTFYHDTTSLDRNHWYRGIGSNNEDKEVINQYVNEFKTGKYYAGKGLNGNGTYVTDSYGYATRFGEEDMGGILYILPKDNAKIVDIDKITTLKSGFIKYLNSDDELYIRFTTSLLDDNGYLAEILGYDIVNLGSHKIILNRASIKVVK